jgi:hypothetical protein
MIRLVRLVQFFRTVDRYPPSGRSGHGHSLPRPRSSTQQAPDGPLSRRHDDRLFKQSGQLSGTPTGRRHRQNVLPHTCPPSASTRASATTMPTAASRAARIGATSRRGSLTRRCSSKPKRWAGGEAGPAQGTTASGPTAGRDESSWARRGCGVGQHPRKA